MTSVSAAVALVLLAPTAQPPTKAAPVDAKKAVAKGLKWLAQQQKPDGSWIGNGDGYPTYLTGHAGVAFLMEGSTLTRGTYAPNLRNALAWVEKNAADSGRIGGTHETETTWDITGHAAAIVFLVCVYDVDDDEPRRKRVATLIERAIAFAAECQSDVGGWGYISGQKIDGYSYPTTVTLQALFAARNAGFAVPKRITERAVRYLISATSRNGAVRSSAAFPETGNDAPDRTATPGAAAAGLMSDGARPEALARWIKKASAGTPPATRDFTNDSLAMFEQYFMARTAYCLGEAGHRRIDPTANGAELVKWSAYKKGAFKALTDAQGADGGWPVAFVGAVHSSALALIVLQLDNGYLPAFSR